MRIRNRTAAVAAALILIATLAAVTPASGQVEDTSSPLWWQAPETTFAQLTTYKGARAYGGTHRAAKIRAMKNIRNADSAAVINAHLGLLEGWHRNRDRNNVKDWEEIASEPAYNAALLADASTVGTEVWLQATPYHNQTWFRDVNGSPVYISLTAEEILNPLSPAELAAGQINLDGNIIAIPAGPNQEWFLQNEFRRTLRRSIMPYLEYLVDQPADLGAANANKACRISFFEEETPFHSANAGGRFWLGRDRWPNGQNYLANSQRAEALHYFITQMPDVFEVLQLELEDSFALAFRNSTSLPSQTARAKAKASVQACSVGMHIGHAPLYMAKPVVAGTPGNETYSFPSGGTTCQTNRVEGFEAIIDRMETIDANSSIADLMPDFIIYDNYFKSAKTYEQFEDDLRDRSACLDEATSGQNIDVLFLAQLHTMNNFRYGRGRTPSKLQIQKNRYLAEELFDGLGYYTKDSDHFAFNSNTPDQGGLQPACVLGTPPAASESINWVKQGTTGDYRRGTNQAGQVWWANFGCSPEEDAGINAPIAEATVGPFAKTDQVVYVSAPNRWFEGMKQLRKFTAS